MGNILYIKVLIIFTTHKYFVSILTYVLIMKTLFIILFVTVLIAAFIATYFIRKEQENSIGNKFLRLIRKFDSWQMMR